MSPRGLRTRPTSDLLRQAIFNVVGSRVVGARVLDVCAGTGAVGLEALSRGAAHTTFVERDRQALACLQANLVSLDAAACARILSGDALIVLADLARIGERFDCVFLDPPYDDDLALRCVEVLAPGGILSDNALLVVQAFHKTPFPSRIERLSRSWNRRYGETQLIVYRKEGECR